MTHGIQPASSVPAETGDPNPVPPPGRDDDPPYAGSGLFCPNCRIVIATTIPLRYCPRCTKRFPHVPADPKEEPLEALDEKIQQTRFAERGWIGWNWPGFLLGVGLGVIAAAVQVDWNPDPFRKRQTVVEVFAWYMFFGGMVGCAVGVCYTSIVRPIWLALVNSKRFMREWYGQGRSPQDTPPTDPRP